MWTNARRVAAHLILFILSKLCSSLIRAQKTSGMGAQPMINYHDPRDIFEKARQALISSVALLRSLAFTRRDIIVRNSWKPSGETSRVREIHELPKRSRVAPKRLGAHWNGHIKIKGTFFSIYLIERKLSL